MTRHAFFAGLTAALALVQTAFAQPVDVVQLAAPDLFSTGARETGLPPTLWRDASPDTLRAVLPLIAAKPLSPAAAALAGRVLATGGNAPAGVGADPAMAGARAAALVALGDLEGASTILARTAGVERDPQLSRAAAEAALFAGEDARACAVSNALTIGRDEVYWLRLRAFCQERAGQAGAAQLTYELAQTQARDPIFGRLMGAKLAGAGDPGAPSSRNGLDFALSTILGLAPEAPASPPPPPTGDDLNAALSGLTGEPAGIDGPTLDRLVSLAASVEAKARPRLQGAALLAAALGAPVSAQARGGLATFTAESKAPAGRAFALDLAGEQKLVGEAAMLSLWMAADAAPAGPAMGDRVRIVRALRQAGLEIDARAFAAEGLLAAK